MDHRLWTIKRFCTIGYFTKLAENKRHLKHQLRSDKACLNCGTQVQDRYCSHCGQENLELKENIGHLISHFFSDLTHYDSKFFLTTKHLFFRPGFLTKEYFLGRRARYLNPVRMYFFISFVFFLVYFSIPNEKNHFFSFKLRTEKDTIGVITVNKKRYVIAPPNARNKSIREYDSIQKVLPANERDKAIVRRLIHHYLKAKEKNGDRAMEVLAEEARHNIPKVMFLLLPFFALLLKWMYSKSKYVYVDHAIFSIHFHVFIFLTFLVFTIVGLFVFISLWIAVALAFLYLVLALWKVYEQSFLFSFSKAFMLSIIYLFIMYVGGQLMIATTFFLME